MELYFLCTFDFIENDFIEKGFTTTFFTSNIKIIEAMPPPHHLPKKIKDAIDRLLDSNLLNAQLRREEQPGFSVYSIQYETRILIHVFFLLSSLKF